MTISHTPETVAFMEKAGLEARKALCLKARCGAIIEKDGDILGTGYNAPPLDNESNRMCLEKYDFTGKPRYDHTCCIHAEWRAILNALENYPEKVKGSRLFFVRVDTHGMIKTSGKPYCTVCSRLALDVGISEFYLWHEDGITSYQTDEYNKLSYEYKVS